MTTPTGRSPGQPSGPLPDARNGAQRAHDEIESPVGGVPPLVPLDAPSGRPEEPVTAGAPVGAGAGPEVLGIPDVQAETVADLEKLRRYLPAFVARANRPETPQSFRNWVRLLRNEIR